MRLFVALLLEPQCLASLQSIQSRLRALDTNSSVRWTDPKGVHLTLRFLGEVREERLPVLVQALAAAVQDRTAPVLGLDGLGAFPSRQRPRVIWIGVEEEGEALSPVQAAVEDAAAGLGWEPERRAFQPHLTLGRVRDTSGRGSPVPRPLLDAIAAKPVDDHPAVRHPRLALMRSHLSPQGARYEELQLWKLR